MRISDWSSDVCSSDLTLLRIPPGDAHAAVRVAIETSVTGLARGVVAPVVCYLLGGLPALFGWWALEELLRGAEAGATATGPFTAGVRWPHALAAWLPMCIAALLLGLAAADRKSTRLNSSH